MHSLSAGMQHGNSDEHLHTANEKRDNTTRREKTNLIYNAIMVLRALAPSL